MTSSFFVLAVIIMASMEERLNRRIKALMEERGMNQKELASRSGLTEASVSKYLSGARKPQLEAIIALAKALDTDADYLLGIQKESSSTYKDIEKMIREKKASLTPEERMRLIMLLSKE